MRKSSRPPQHANAVGFPSPTQDYATANPKFLDDCTRMNFAIQQSLPEAVRRIVRDHWEKCLLGSEFHQAFVVSLSHYPDPFVFVSQRSPIISPTLSLFYFLFMFYFFQIEHGTFNDVHKMNHLNLLIPNLPRFLYHIPYHAQH